MGSTALSDIETRLFISNEVAEAGKEDVEAAVQYAKGAWEEWFAKDASDRSAALVKLGELIVANTAKFAELEAISMGTPSAFYHMQTSIASKLLNYFAGIAGDPYGDVAAIIPWNVPILMALNKIAPAVAAGNAIIMKTSEKPPRSPSSLPNSSRKPASSLPASCKSSPAPAKVEKLSPATWRSARSLLRVASAPLGGKASIILFEDGNVEEAARECAISVAFNSGQTCTSAARLYVQESVLEPFLAVFRPTFEGFLTNHGDPLDPKVTHGPQADKLQYESVLKFIEAGKNSTAQMLTGGNLRTEEEAITRANATEYGLFSSVFTRDIFRAIRIAKKYESGTVTINCTSHYQAVDMAFGDVKGSGDGREYGRWGLDSWLEIKSVLIDLTE
ncbi:betaine-aldehyde dehydrogenase [Talaromyces pinophilus]|uniref:aldehyde dehydrogenase (NAD(+)) n=1 Tax=Talaromyces pinophilus TaxID=128442 RepID=A0A6V8HGC1_TALPI|nr:betaine-aldehyde dehydrogenase [Talaromyces pinophilus]